jgi:hypothetical protein
VSMVDSRVLFERRPAAATTALTIAGASAVATMFQGLATILGLSNFIFDFTTYTDPMNLRGLRLGLVSIFWGFLLLLSCYRALAPRPGARYAVLALVGLKVMLMLGTTSGLPVWQWLVLLAIAATPIALLLTRSNNRYYGSQF